MVKLIKYFLLTVKSFMKKAIKHFTFKILVKQIVASPYPIRWLPLTLCAQVTSASGPGSRSNRSNDRCWQFSQHAPF